MAWRSHGTSNLTLIQNLRHHRIITHDRIMKAMEKIDRKNFVQSSNQDEAYYDQPVPIGHGATISAPHMHAHVLELLESNLVSGAKVLDVGSGSGYLLAAFAELVFNPELSPTDSNSASSSSSSGTTSSTTTSNPLNETGKVYGVEHIPELVTFSVNNLNKNNQTKQWLQEGKISVQVGDGRYGLPDTGPYDAIHVGAAAPQIPQELVDQLANNGRMIIPVGKYSQELMELTKDGTGNITKRKLVAVQYVPLTDKDKQETRAGLF